MKLEAAARRHAPAAFDIAREGDERGAWARDLRALGELVGQPGVLDVLSTSRVPPQQKERLLRAGLSDVSPLALNLARLLVSKGRIALADQIREGFDRLGGGTRGGGHAPGRAGG